MLSVLTSGTVALVFTISSTFSEVRPLRPLGIIGAVSDERKDRINKDFMNKEIRTLTFECLLNNAAMIKKEKD